MPLDLKSDEQELKAFNVRMDDLYAIDLTFLQGFDQPTLAYLAEVWVICMYVHVHVCTGMFMYMYINITVHGVHICHGLQQIECYSYSLGVKELWQ